VVRGRCDHRRYEFLADILKNATEKTLPIGVTRRDTIIGPLVDVFLHESGHAVFDLLKIPVFGREEDAADQFSAYIMLRQRRRSPTDGGCRIPI
jgi:hypothetical protein